MWLLKIFKTKTLWKEIIARETFDESGTIEASMIWSHVFNRSPELAGFLKHREIMLLKGVALHEKPAEFLLGQIAENRLWQRFDTGLESSPANEVVPKLPTLKPIREFLKGIKKHDEHEVESVRKAS
jgi:hypothetical protein